VNLVTTVESKGFSVNTCLVVEANAHKRSKMSAEMYPDCHVQPGNTVLRLPGKLRHGGPAGHKC
jgi:hypothetical protein